MTTLYHTLTPATQRAIDLHEHAAYRYECAHTEANRADLEAAREVMLRAVRHDCIAAVMESDEAAANLNRERR